jgi:HK97 gp10 family phage protein
MGKIGMRMKGDKALLKKLNNVAKSGAYKACRKAVVAGTQPLFKAVKSNVPVDEGNLKKAMVKKVSGKRGNYNGIVGADVDFVGENGEQPIRYDHLVEYGHDGVPARSFVRKGFDESGAAARAAYEAKLAAEIEKELTRGS